MVYFRANSGLFPRNFHPGVPTSHGGATCASYDSMGVLNKPKRRMEVAQDVQGTVTQEATES